MSAPTVALYVVAFGLWWYVVRRDRGIGIGFRFLFALNVILFFLVGPMLGEVFGTTDRRYLSPTFEACVRLSLYAFLAYLIGSYLAYPALIGRSRLIPPRWADRMAVPARLDAQWKVGWALVGMGFVSLPICWVVHALPTLGAVLGQLLSVSDTGLVMLCLYAAHARRSYALAAVLVVLLGKGLVLAAMTGFAGSVFTNGMFLACLTFLSIRYRIATVAALAVAAVFAFLPAKMWLDGRDRLRTAIYQGMEFEERLGITIDIFLKPETLSARDQDLVSAYRSRGDYSDLLAAAVAHTPAVEPYAMGQTYLDVFVAVIPRFLWPDKPFKAGGNQFVSKYTGIRFNEYTSVGMNYLFEMYVNFGIPGVVIGMFLLGLILGWMESLYYRKALNNLFYEYCLILCSWSMCMHCDKMADLAMTIPPAVALCLLIHIVLRSQICSQYLPSIWRVEAPAIRRPHRRLLKGLPISFDPSRPEPTGRLTVEL